MKHEKYKEVVELYTILEKNLGNVLNVQCSNLMDEPTFVKVYRLILGYSLKDFASESNVDVSLLKGIEDGEKLEYNIATKICDTITRLIESKKLDKTSIDILSKNYLMQEIIASKNIQSLAKRQKAYLFFGERPLGIFVSVSYALFLGTVLAFGANLPSIIEIFFLALFFLSLTIAAYYYIFLRKQFFLWDNDIISNFISLLLKKSFPESYDDVKKFLLFLASRLDDSYIKYHDPYWYFDAIRKELADVIRYNICPNINETNKDKILNYFEKINTFLSSYSPEQYEEIKKIISNIKSDFVEIRFADPVVPQVITEFNKSYWKIETSSRTE